MQEQDAATATYEQALELARQTSDLADDANALFGLANYYSQIARYEKSVEAYKESAAIWTRVGDTTKAQTVQKRLWGTYRRVKNYAAAMEISTGSLGISEPLEGAVVTNFVDLVGLVEHPEFKRWQIDLLANGDEQQASYIGRGFGPAWGRFYTLDTTPFPDGNYTIRLRIIREDTNYDEYFRKIVVRNTALSLAGAIDNGFVSPTAGENVFGTLRVTGTALHDDFRKWELDLLLYGDPHQATHLQTGNRPSNGRLFTLDTQEFPNGSHTLRLRVVRSDSNYDEYTVDFGINN